jgi:hypothetical protein
MIQDIRRSISLVGDVFSLLPLYSVALSSLTDDDIEGSVIESMVDVEEAALESLDEPMCELVVFSQSATACPGET